MELVYECSYVAETGPPLAVGAGPFGTRMVVTVTGGQMTGERLNGTFVGAGGDWVLVGADGFGRLDVRGQIQTDDGALLYLSYTGVLETNDAVVAAMAGGSTDYGDHYFRTTPRFESGDERYAWVNTTVFVARGRLRPGGVEYEVYRVT